MKKIALPGLVAGIILFIISYGGLYLSVRFFPSLFIEYNSPLFNSDGSRDLLFYLHPFIISFALSWFWDRFKGLFRGTFVLRGIEFGFVYAMVALLPVMWITFSSLDITIATVLSWFLYGLMQAMFAGLIFAKINP
ncbi:MAG TPA: hypothetical protein VL125_06270 [Pelobium sp.]|nr:hypothetical protein [Pelobium sp.]